MSSNASAPAREGRDSLLHRLSAVLHQQSDCGRRRVELAHVIFVHNLPHAAYVRVSRKALKLKHKQYVESKNLREQKR